MKKLILLFCVAMLLAACNSGSSTSDQAADNRANPPPIANRSSNTAADNTAVNAFDRGNQNVTAQDQALGSKADVRLTRKIRKALVADRSLSTYGKNVKIVTVSGIVTLRGPVKTAREKMAIAEKAQRIAGKKIENELDVVTQ